MEKVKGCFLAWFATLVFSATVYAEFVDNGDDTVTDTSTGLTWEIKTDDGGARDRDNTYTWRQALCYCEYLDLAGHTDWRLPDREELRSLVDYSKYGPSIDETFFPNTQAGLYWSSSTRASNAGEAWYASFFNGGDRDGSKSDSLYVRAVRGGLCWVWTICIDGCQSEESCDACATDISTAFTMTSDEACINYFKVVDGLVLENAMTISGNVVVGIEGGQIILEP